jgi:hypothetical protein
VIENGNDDWTIIKASFLPFDWWLCFTEWLYCKNKGWKLVSLVCSLRIVLFTILYGVWIHMAEAAFIYILDSHIHRCTKSKIQSNKLYNWPNIALHNHFDIFNEVEDGNDD